MNGGNVNTNHGGQTAGEDPRPGRGVLSMWEWERVDENGLDQRGQVVPQNEILDLTSLGQALPNYDHRLASGQQPTSGQSRASNQMPIYHQPQAHQARQAPRARAPQAPGVHQTLQRWRLRWVNLRPRPNPNPTPAEEFDTYYMPAVAAFMAGDFPKTALQTFQAYLLARSLYDREIKAFYNSSESGDPEKYDQVHAAAMRRLQEYAFRIQTMVTDLENELARRQKLAAESGEELDRKADVLRRLQRDVIPHCTQILLLPV